MSTRTIQLEHPGKYMLAGCTLGGISVSCEGMKKLATSKEYHEQVR